MKKYLSACLAALLMLPACREFEMQAPENTVPDKHAPLSEVARILSSLPLAQGQMDEVRDAVSASSQNGYDEEYMMRDLLKTPGAGVGSADGKAPAHHYDKPLRELITEYLEEKAASKAEGGTDSVQAWLDAMEDSDIQIYWPYSEDWDGSSLPVITWDPGYGAESNYGYELFRDSGGRLTVRDSVVVTEALALSRPVWVINRNDDSAFTPLDLYAGTPTATTAAVAVTAAAPAMRTLRLKSFRMLRHYDSWFGGASEFRIQCGAANGFKASTEAELKNYKPSITDFTLVVRRKQLGEELPLDALLMTDFSQAMEKMAFLVTEDDGGTRTSWKCSAVVKYNSRSYGFEMEIPYNEKDDIVWRGQLTTTFLQSEDTVSSRFGDVVICFALE
ncbi:MAG: hypothetical protein IJS62_01205 [Bacteroidales bacterium]|nr:hypothetical protein [Bacteroidales bacterium]